MAYIFAFALSFLLILTTYVTYSSSLSCYECSASEDKYCSKDDYKVCPPDEDSCITITYSKMINNNPTKRIRKKCAKKKDSCYYFCQKLKQYGATDCQPLCCQDDFCNLGVKNREEVIRLGRNNQNGIANSSKNTNSPICMVVLAVIIAKILR